MENEQADAGLWTAELVSRDKIFRHVREQQGNIHFPWSPDHDEQDWQPYPVDPNSGISCVVMTYSGV